MFLAEIEITGVLKDVLHIIEEYGADKVFMLWFFLLYKRANKRNEDLQDKRIEDNQKSLKALIEAKFIIGELSKNIEKISIDVDKVENKVERNFEKVRDLYGEDLNNE